MKSSHAVVALGLFFVCSFDSANSASAQRSKKLIEFGWDQPTTAFLKQHIDDMERMPFDGVVFSAHYHDARGRDIPLEWTCFSKNAVSWEALQPALADVKATPFRRFTDNFLRLNTAPADVDWFEDFAPIVNNMRMGARFSRAARIKGILFDTEAYEKPLFSYPQQKAQASHTFEEYAAQVRRRGEEIMQAIQQEYPGLTVFLTVGYNFAGSKPEDLPKNRYGLLAAFLDGLYAAARGRTQIVDGYETSYEFRFPAQFERGYQIMRKYNLAMTRVPTAYKRRLVPGFGVWMDPDWRKRGWRTDAVRSNPVAPEQLELSLTSALRRTDRYVWLYSEQPRWWPRQKLPDAYIDAVFRARQAVGLPNPPRDAVPGEQGAPTANPVRIRKH